MSFSFAQYSFGQIPDGYDNSVQSAFNLLLQNQNAQLIYLIELYPYDDTLEQTLEGVPPFAGGSFGQFETTYYGGVSPVYLSDVGFTTEPGDTLESVYFIGQVDNPLQYENSILSGQDFGSGNLSFGSIVIQNGNGALDFLNDRYFAARRVVVKAGAKGFAYDDFATVFEGAANDIEADEERITITIRNNTLKLDRLLVTGVYAGTGSLEGGDDLANKPKPLCYGVVKNIEPVLVDAANLIYQVHDGSTQAVTAVRDSGVILTGMGDVADITAASVGAGQYKTQLSGGYIKLGSTPSGRITADVQGDSTGGFVPSIGGIVQRVVKTKLGAQSLSSSDIDEGSFNALDSELAGDYGVYVTDQVSATSIIDELVDGNGAYWTYNRQGLLTAGVVNEPETPILTITADMIDEQGIRVAETIAPAYRISVGYAPVWTVQKEDELAGATTDADRQFVGTQYRYVTYENELLQAQNQQAIERVFNTSIAVKADAEVLLARLAVIYSTKRRVFQVPLYRSLFRLYLGDTVKIVYDRFGLNEGVNLLVVGLSEDAETGLTTLSLWG